MSIRSNFKTDRHCRWSWRLRCSHIKFILLFFRSHWFCNLGHQSQTDLIILARADITARWTTFQAALSIEWVVSLNCHDLGLCLSSGVLKLRKRVCYWQASIFLSFFDWAVSFHISRLLISRRGLWNDVIVAMGPHIIVCILQGMLRYSSSISLLLLGALYALLNQFCGWVILAVNLAWWHNPCIDISLRSSTLRLFSL